MPDVFTKEKRSLVMAAIRGKGNASTELRMILLLREFGIVGWRRHVKILGRPDFVFPSKKVALFVDGTFWHGHPTLCRVPSNNREFWKGKIDGNRARDRRVNKELRSKGWTVIRVWEHDLSARPKIVAKRIRKGLAGPVSDYLE
jgi:DNA mismatch endonuclease (patch repair protein)